VNREIQAQCPTILPNCSLWDLVRQLLRQRMQPKEEMPNREPRGPDDTHHDISTSVSPGGVMKEGRWCAAAG